MAYGPEEGKTLVQSLADAKTEVDKIKNKINELDKKANILAYEIIERVAFNLKAYRKGMTEQDLEDAWEWNKEFQAMANYYDGGDTTLKMLDAIATLSGVGALAKVGVKLTAETVTKLAIRALAKAGTAAEKKLLNNQLAHILQVSMAGAPGRMSDEMVDIFRAVGPEEYADIMKTGLFRMPPNGSQMKQFGFSLDETLKYADWDSSYAAIIKAQIPKSALKNFNVSKTIDSFIFKNGVLTVPEKSMKAFNELVKGTIKDGL